MAEFAWEARGRMGEMRKGTMEADTEAAVHARLRAQQLNPTKVSKKFSMNFQLGSGVDSKDLVKFIRQFATMIDAGLPLVQCLEILANQEPNKYFQGVLRDIKSTVEQGATFSDALRRHPKIFDDLFTNLVQAGEVGGILDTILNRLAVYIEKRVKLKRQVKSALVYPTAILFVAILVIIVMLTWVIPAFRSMFAEFGGEDQLPGITKFVISVSEGFLDNAIWIILVIGAISTAIGYSYRQPKGKKFWHKLLLTMPILGPVMRKIAVARFTRTLGTLLSSGVPILDAMNIVARAAAGCAGAKSAASAIAAVIRSRDGGAETALGFLLGSIMGRAKIYSGRAVRSIGGQ